MKIKLPLDNWKSGNNHSLNMNNYRNWHYRTSNNIKKAVANHLKDTPKKKYKRVRISYVLFFKDKRIKDLMNFVAVADKFILDAIVGMRMLEDDNYKYVIGYDSIDFIIGESDINYIEMEIKRIE